MLRAPAALGLFSARVTLVGGAREAQWGSRLPLAEALARLGADAYDAVVLGTWWDVGGPAPYVAARSLCAAARRGGARLVVGGRVLPTDSDSVGEFVTIEVALAVACAERERRGRQARRVFRGQDA